MSPAWPMKDSSVPNPQPPDDFNDPDLAEARLRQQAIGVGLRHMFDAVINEPVPDEFLSILQKADERNRGGA
jgi:hypothetical protein